jgi:hypothetical protein
MKTKYSSNSELAHIWANDPDSSIYKSANSMSCHNGVLYSYSTAIAHIVNPSEARYTVIHNSASYSNTTSKHQGYARASVRHYQNEIYLSIPKMGLTGLVFGQRDFDELIKVNNEAKAEALLVKASRSRIHAGSYYSSAIFIYENLNKYAQLLNLNYAMPDLSTVQAQAVEAKKKAEALAKIAQAKRIKEQAEALENWRAGHDVRNNFEVTALRIKNEEIQTTRGARIPLDHAVKFWGLIKSWHEKGIQYVKDHHSINLGHYTVNKFDGKTLTVGCHSIPFSEIQIIATQLKLA